MSRNGSGTYSLPAGNPVVTGTTISSTWANNTLSDIATALTQSIAYDGQTTPTANLPMGGFKHTGVAVGAALTDYARYDQMQNSSAQWLTGVTGTDTITASAAVTPAAYSAGQTFKFVSAGANTGAVTLNVSSLGAKSVTKNGTTALSAGNIPSGAVVQVIYDGTQFQITNISTSGFASSGANSDITGLSALTNIPWGQNVQDFRLTLTSGTPITTSDVIGATTIYCTPYKGKNIGLYDGSKWNVRASSEFSLALGTLTSGKPYDVFCYDNAGTPTLEFLVWTNDTTRATALAYQDGILVKSGATTRRYLGTFYTTSTTATEDSAANRYLWNYYHRVRRYCSVVDATASWTYTTASFRQANNSAGNKINYVCGLAEDEVLADISACASNSTGGSGSWATSGIGIDSTSVNSAFSARAGIQVNSCYTQAIAHYEGIPGIGKHSLVWLEFAGATGTQTWYGTAGEIVSGIHASIMA